jgi:hypothetical protein
LKDIAKKFNISASGARCLNHHEDFDSTHIKKDMSRKHAAHGFQKKTFNYMEADETKRSEYLEQIKDIDPAKIVYIDESGIEMS